MVLTSDSIFSEFCEKCRTSIKCDQIKCFDKKRPVVDVNWEYQEKRNHIPEKNSCRFLNILRLLQVLRFCFSLPPIEIVMYNLNWHLSNSTCLLQFVTCHPSNSFVRTTTTQKQGLPLLSAHIQGFHLKLVNFQLTLTLSQLIVSFSICKLSLPPIEIVTYNLYWHSSNWTCLLQFVTCHCSN